jgi:uncharacterized protein (DUF608 family)
MDRRDFLKTTAAGGAGFTLLPLLAPQPGETLPTAIIPADKGISPDTFAAWKRRGERRVYRGPNLYAIGMPVGGICAGQLYLLGDGTLGGWHIDGRLHSSGYGSDNYRTRRAERELVQGFRIHTGKRTPEETVALDESAGWEIEFIGEYPVAEVRYRRRSGSALSKLADQLDVTLRACSPFCPLNARESALPCTVMRFLIRNPSNQPVMGSLVGVLENGVERAEPGEVQPLRRNRVMADKGLSAVFMDAAATEARKDPRPDRLIADFEGEIYQGWKAEGEAFGKGPVRGTQPHQNTVSGYVGDRLVNSFVAAADVDAGDKPTGTLTSDSFQIDRDYLTFLIGGGNHRGQTCINLLIDGKVARTATGRNSEKLEPRAWDVRDLDGKQAVLQIVDAATGGWGHINIDQITLVDTLPDSLRRPSPDSPGNGSMCFAFFGDADVTTEPPLSGKNLDLSVSTIAHPQGPVARIDAPFNLKPGETRELTFVTSWFFPNLHTSQGQMYTNWFKDALEVARFVRDNDARLWGQTELFRKTFYEDTTLPWWLTLRLMMPTSYLATGTSQWWKNGRFWGWEGVGCCHGTCAHVWNYAHADARLFPELARSVRTMQDLGAAFDEGTGRVAFRGEAKNGFEYAADGQAGTVLKCYREHLCSPDDSFLKANWPRIKTALEFLIAKDAELDPAGKPDGVIRGMQDNTFDIAFVGPNTFIGALYLAALEAGAAMAQRLGEADAASRYLDLYRRGRQWTEKNLFNSEYFIQKVPADQSTQWQYGDGCLTDQLFGQTWARCVGLGTVYDEAMVKTALKSVYRYNFAPPGGSIRQYAAAYPPEREFVRDREGALLVCTWPKGGRFKEPVRYRDEVWTGEEYQAAAGMMWEGLIDESLAIVHAVDDRYDGALHNPWNEVECGDHYSRAMAAWGVFQAACGFFYDGPARALRIDPRLSPEHFAAFFSGAEGWGLISQQRDGTKQINRIEVRWGKLDLERFEARTAAPGAKPSAKLDGKTVPCQPADADGFAGVALQAALPAGSTLEIAWDH